MEYMQGTWIVATSGGPDSMALLSMCLEAGIDCVVAHVNYHYRPQAELEEAYIREFCWKKKIPCFVRNEAFVWQGNFEAAARKWRYEFFVELVQQYHYTGVLVAHHRDDLLETYCMQKEKNIIPSTYGLASEIKYQGVCVKRLLLDCYKKDLEQYCKTHDIPYFEDQSNLDLRYTRNRFRHTYLSQMSLSQKEVLYKEIVEKNHRLCHLREQASKHIQNHRFIQKQYCLLEEDVRLTILRMTMDQIGLYRQRRVHLQEIDSIVMKQTDFCFEQENYQLVVDDGVCFWMKQPRSFFARYDCLEELMAADGRGIFQIEPGMRGKNAVTVRVDDFPLTIRTWRAGDSIQMRFGRKSLHRYFIDRHIALYRRKEQVVLENRAGRIILVPGLGCDVEHYSEKPDFNVIMCYNS